MGNPIVFDRTVELMRDRLSLNSLQQEVVSSNLANINTPRYRAKELSFSQVLNESMEDGGMHLVTSDPKHSDPAELKDAMENPEITESGAVDLDWEMMKLSKNSVEYQYMVTLLNKKFATLKLAIDEGGK